MTEKSRKIKQSNREGSRERESQKRQRANCATFGWGCPFPKIRVCTKPISYFLSFVLKAQSHRLLLLLLHLRCIFFLFPWWVYRSSLTMVADSKSKSDISFAGTFASSAFAACFAEVINRTVGNTNNSVIKSIKSKMTITCFFSNYLFFC